VNFGLSLDLCSFATHSDGGGCLRSALAADLPVAMQCYPAAAERACHNPPPEQCMG
jgi:hypothetical protein